MWNGLTMKPHAKNRWVDALRSGKYKQEKGQLVVLDRDHENVPLGTVQGYCCLGVLMETEKFRREGETFYVPSANFYLECLVMPDTDAFEKYFDLNESLLSKLEGLSKKENIETLFNLLTRFNDAVEVEGDNRHLDFNGIADWIEANL